MVAIVFIGRCSAFTQTCADILSRGWVDPNHLIEASELLHQVPKDNFLFLTLHYPLFDRRGNPHDKWTRNVRNGEIFRDWLTQHPRIDALIHGHEHHGYHIQYNTREGTRHSINPEVPAMLRKNIDEMRM